MYQTITIILCVLILKMGEQKEENGLHLLYKSFKSLYCLLITFQCFNLPLKLLKFVLYIYVRRNSFY